MNKKSLLMTIISLMIIAALVLPTAGSSPVAAKDVTELKMFQASKFDAHYVVPRDATVETLLKDEGVILPGANAAQIEAAVQKFRTEWAKRNPDTPNPQKLEELLKGEQGGYIKVTPESPIKSLVVPVEFPNETTFEWCDETVTMAGPLHNEVAPPGPRDNNSIWYEDTTPELYDELYFGVGPDAGVIVNHPNLGEVDLRGNTMANYYLEQSEGKFLPVGMIYPKWLQAAYAEGWYGADSCSGSNHNIRAADLVEEVVDAVNVDDPTFAWQDFDGDGDGFVDNFTVIHAGAGQEGGGGAQGSFAIWSHASALNPPTGHLACTAGSAGCPDRDIFVRSYSMDPEMIDIGVIAEEFGHAAFGLPDIYTTDYQASPSNWTIMEAGAWNGILGGMQPAPFPLFFRYLVGWAQPVEMDYDTATTTIKVGQHSIRPLNTEQGLKINLPDQVIETPNPLGTGNAWWSDRADLADFFLAHDFDLAGTTAPIFSFASYWSFEEDYDYGYVEVSEDGGVTWTKLPDMDGIFADDGAGNLGLNGEGEGILRFDLAAYAGKLITLRLHYTSDVGVQWAGWWGDDFSLDDGATNLFADDVEAGTDGWTTNHFVIVPLTRIYPFYYLAEWRNNSGFDRGLAYPYQTVYNNDATNEWEVDRCAHTVPGMLLWLRNGARDFDYTLSDSWYDPPSTGPKHALLVVDSHFWPMSWDTYRYASGANLRITSRCQPANATFTLQETTPFTIRLGYNPATGQYLDEPVETKTFAPLPAVSQFHDSMGYYPGLWFRPATGGLYFWQAEASTVVPAQANYSTRITWLDQTPVTDLYGYDLGWTVLGSGNPGDEGVQYGLHLAVVDKATDGSWGLIRVWNSPTLIDLQKTSHISRARPGELIKYTLKVVNKTPVAQRFVLNDPLPAEVTIVNGGPFYDAETNSIHWEYWVPANSSRAIFYSVKVNKNVAAGTVITNEAVLTDGAQGDTASVSVTVR